MSYDLRIFLESNGIVYQTTCPYTPKQNGIDERKNRYLLNVVGTSLLETNTPLSYWLEHPQHRALFHVEIKLLPPINPVPCRLNNFFITNDMLHLLLFSQTVTSLNDDANFFFAFGGGNWNPHKTQNPFFAFHLEFEARTNVLSFSIPKAFQK